MTKMSSLTFTEVAKNMLMLIGAYSSLSFIGSKVFFSAAPRATTKTTYQLVDVRDDGSMGVSKPLADMLKQARVILESDAETGYLVSFEVKGSSFDIENKNE